MAAAFRDSIRSELDAEVLADVKLQFPNQVEGAAFLASIQQKLIAAGVAAEAASVQAQQWGARLFEAEKKGGSAVQGVIDQINAATQATIASTTAAAEAATAATAAVSTEVAKQVAVTTTATRDTLEAIKRAEAQKVSVTARAQTQIASIAISAAEATGDAWVASATRTTKAWLATRASTVGFSSIVDIQVIGSEHAKQLGDDQAAAARRTSAEWERVNRDLAIDHPGGEAERLRRDRDRGMDRDGDGFRGDGFRDGGCDIHLRVDSILDGDKVAETVVRKAAGILDDAGLGSC